MIIYLIGCLVTSVIWISIILYYGYKNLGNGKGMVLGGSIFLIFTSWFGLGLILGTMYYKKDDK